MGLLSSRWQYPLFFHHRFIKQEIMEFLLWKNHNLPKPFKIQSWSWISVQAQWGRTHVSWRDKTIKGLYIKLYSLTNYLWTITSQVDTLPDGGQNTMSVWTSDVRISDRRQMTTRSTEFLGQSILCFRPLSISSFRMIYCVQVCCTVIPLRPDQHSAIQQHSHERFLHFSQNLFIPFWDACVCVHISQHKGSQWCHIKSQESGHCCYLSPHKTSEAALETSGIISLASRKKH